MFYEQYHRKKCRLHSNFFRMFIHIFKKVLKDSLEKFLKVGTCRIKHLLLDDIWENIILSFSKLFLCFLSSIKDGDQGDNVPFSSHRVASGHRGKDIYEGSK